MSNIFQRRIEDTPDRTIFAFFTIGGGLLIFIPRILNDLIFNNNFFIDALVVLFACFIIFLYTYIVLKTLNQVGAALDRSSDNAYYLGLLFTLFSLSYSLIKLMLAFDDGSFKGGSQRVIQLLPDFGLALFTTITGIGMRVWIQQFRGDAGNADNEAREELAKTVRELRTQMRRAVADLSTMSQGFNNSSKELSNKVIETLEDATKRNAQSIDEVGTNLKEVNEAMMSMSKATQDQISSINTFSSQVSDSITNAILQLRSKLDEVSEAPEEFNKSVSNLSEKIQLIGESLVDVSGKLNESAVQISLTVDSLGKIVSEEKQKEIENTLGMITGKMRLMDPKLNDANSSIDNLKQTINTSSEKIKNAQTDLEGNASTALQNAQDANKATQGYVKALTDSAKILKDDTEK